MMDNELNQLHEPLRKRSCYVCGPDVGDPTVVKNIIRRDLRGYIPIDYCFVHQFITYICLLCFVCLPYHVKVVYSCND